MTLRQGLPLLALLAACGAAGAAHARSGPGALGGDPPAFRSDLVSPAAPGFRAEPESFAPSPAVAGPFGNPGPLAGASLLIPGSSGPQLSVALALLEGAWGHEQSAGRTAADLRLAGGVDEAPPALARLLPGSAAWDASLATGYVFLGVEAVALLSYLRARGAEGDAGAEGSVATMAADGSWSAAAVSLAGAAGARLGAPGVDEPGLWQPTQATAVGAWRGAAAAPTAAVAAPAGGASARSMAFVNSVADRVAGVVDAFRGLRLNSFEIAENTRLRVDAKTGRHGRCFVILTRKF